jgi:hypothetical protein
MYPLTYIDRDGRTVTVTVYGADGTVTDMRFLGYETSDDPDSGDCDDDKDKDDTDLYDVPFVVGE